MNQDERLSQLQTLKERIATLESEIAALKTAASRRR